MNDETHQVAHVSSASLDEQRRDLFLAYAAAALNVATHSCPAVTDITLSPEGREGLYRVSDAGCIHEGACLGGLQPAFAALGAVFFNDSWDLTFHGIDSDRHSLTIAPSRLALAQENAALEHALGHLSAAYVAHYEGLVLPTYVDDGERFFEERYLPALTFYAAVHGYEMTRVREGLYVLHHAETCHVAVWEQDGEERWPVSGYEAALSIASLT